MSIDILMPALSPTMSVGKISKWLVKAGDSVKAGDIIAEIETDKATMEVETADQGTVACILVAGGSENVAINTLIAVLAEKNEDIDVVRKAAELRSNNPQTTQTTQITSPTQIAANAPPLAEKPALPQQSVIGNSSDDRLFISPLARRLAKNANIDPAKIIGSGHQGRIVKADIDRVAISGGAALTPPPLPQKTAIATPGTAPVAVYKEIANDGMRSAIARRLTLAKSTIPHFYLSMDIELDALLALRGQVNACAEVKVSVNDFIIKAAAMALIKVPGVNSTWCDSHIKQYQHADIAVAVAIDGGLMTPIVFAAEEKSIVNITKTMKDLGERAKKRLLKPFEFEGGTFSISNLGMFGIKDFVAIINPPHAAILAIGAGEQRPVIKNNQLAIATVMTVTLSCDHRVVDGAMGANFLNALKNLIINPLSLLI